eukprot:285120-Rhodomonas_salina.1
MSGTDIAYVSPVSHAMRVPAVSSTDIAYGGTRLSICCYLPARLLCDVPYSMACAAITLRTRHVTPHTGKAYGAGCLRVCYAMSGTDIAYAARAPACKSRQRKSTRTVSSQFQIAPKVFADPECCQTFFFSCAESTVLFRGSEDGRDFENYIRRLANIPELPDAKKKNE